MVAVGAFFTIGKELGMTETNTIAEAINLVHQENPLHFDTNLTQPYVPILYNWTLLLEDVSADLEGLAKFWLENDGKNYQFQHGCTLIGDVEYPEGGFRQKVYRLNQAEICYDGLVPEVGGCAHRLLHLRDNECFRDFYFLRDRLSSSMRSVFDFVKQSHEIAYPTCWDYLLGDTESIQPIVI